MSGSLHPDQLALVELISKNKFTLAYGSSRGGKTYAFFFVLVVRALQYAGSNHCVIRSTAASIPSTVWPTVMKVLKAVAPGYREEVDINNSNRCITLHNGSTIWFFGAQDEDAVEKIMGAEFATILLNEVVNLDFTTYQKVITRLNASDANDGVRLSLKLFADCNPKSKAHWVYQQWIKKVVPDTERPLFNPDQFAFMAFDRYSNPGIDPDYYDEMLNYNHEERTRFLDGEWYDEVEGALFSAKDLEDNRQDTPKAFDSVIVGVDPSVSNTPTSDETGIITLGCVHTHLSDGTTRKDVYPLRDSSGRYHPHEWAAKVRDAYQDFDAAAVVVEINQGGDMNVFTIRGAHPRANVLTVRPGGGQGKNIRAIPIAREMREGRIHFPRDDSFKDLEAQLLSMTGDYDRRKNKSPDRLDAFVYAAAELLDGAGTPSKVVASTAVGFWR